MRKKVVIINVGVSGAGKSTWTRDYIKKHNTFMRVNRDDIRTVVRGTLKDYWLDKNVYKTEDLVTELESSLFLTLIDKGFDVVIDNTNLNVKVVKKWMSFIEFWNDKFAEEQGKIEVIFKIFPEKDVSLLRDRVGERDNLKDKALDYISKQADSLDAVVKHIQDNYKENMMLSTAQIA